MGVIEVHNVTKSFKIYKERAVTLKERIIGRKDKVEAFTALSDVSLDVAKGETVGLLGRNGSGKSTLLKMLTGIIQPDGGKISIQGKVSSLLELGAGFHPDFTGRENIFMNAALLGLNKKQIREKLDDIIAFSELKDYIENPVRNYSSGMYMRLAFSVAIMVEPDILLIDEVLAVGDAAFQQKCMDQLLKLKSQGKTIVFVSHDLGAMDKLCDRVAWINNSKIVAEGEPRRVIDQYLIYLSEEENKRLIAENDEKIAESQSFSVEAENQILNINEDSDRWGNRHVEIVDVSLRDNQGNIKMSFLSGSEMAIKMRYKANQNVARPVFGISISNIEGVVCYGTNTQIDRYQITQLRQHDEGEIEVVIPSLDLVSGTFYLSVGASDYDDNQFDYHNKKYVFKVSSVINDVGIAKIKHEWKFEVVERG